MMLHTPVKLDSAFTPGTMGDCRAWCGRENVYLVGILKGDTLCVACFESSKERRFNVFCNGGDDILSEHDTLENAMASVTEYLNDPTEYGRYAPFRIEAQSEWSVY